MKKITKNIPVMLAVLVGYCLVYLLGRLICADMEGRSFFEWLTATDSKYYLFGWLTQSSLFRYAALVSTIPALFGKYRFSILTFAVFTAALIIGEPLGNNPEGAALGHGHYGWAIWLFSFLAAMVFGSLWEVFAAKKLNESRKATA